MTQAPAVPVLFRDARFAVLDKPAGLPVHPARNAPGPSVEDCFPALGRARAGPWLAHRLDRDTAGCLVVALKRSALLAAQACFAEGRAAKTYWAVVQGAPPAASGTRRSRLVRVARGGKVGEGAGAQGAGAQGAGAQGAGALGREGHGWAWHIAERAHEGDPAETGWRVLGTGDGLAWLELTPRTGRTHQIRVHCAALGCPILGDPVYGGGGTAPLHLLARRIALPLVPVVAAEAPPPPHMRAALAACGFAA